MRGGQAAARPAFRWLVLVGLAVSIGAFMPLAAAGHRSAPARGASAAPPGLIAYDTTSGTRVRLVVAAGSGAGAHLPFAAAPIQQYQPAWSRAGRLAFVGLVHGDPATAEILVSAPSGRALRQLTRNDWEDDFPTWSPDGREIAFYSSRPRGTGIWVMRSNGTGQRFLAATAASVSWAPAWSPDGGRIAFVSGLGRSAEIYTVRPDGTGLTQLTHNDSYDIDPAWSPNGRWIALSRRLDRTGGIWVMRPDGRGAHPLTHGDDTHPTWSSDGRWIAFARKVGDSRSRIYVVTLGGKVRPLQGAYALTGADPALSPAPTRG